MKAGRYLTTADMDDTMDRIISTLVRAITDAEVILVVVETRSNKVIRVDSQLLLLKFLRLSSKKSVILDKYKSDLGPTTPHKVPLQRNADPRSFIKPS